MADLLWPPPIVPGGSHLAPVSNVGQFSSPLTQARRTVDRSGHFWKLTLDPPVMKGVNRALLESFLSSGFLGSDRILAPDHSYVARGAFPAVELLSNGSFENGTTDWTGTGSSFYTQAVSDRVCRATRVRVSGTAPFAIARSAATTVTPFVPYAVRMFLRQGRGAFPSGFSLYDNTAGARIGSVSTAFGMLTGAAVFAANPLIALNDEAASGPTPGDFIDIHYASMARCLLVDARPNGLLHSDDFTNAAWLKTSGDTVTGNAGAAPDGTTTADDFVENAASQEHYVEQAYTVPAAAADFCGVIDLRASGRTWVLVRLVEDTGGTFASVYVNLASPGALGQSAAGVNWANVRAFVRARGNDWHRVHIVARKTNAATSIRLRLNSTSGDGASSTQTGLNGTAFRMWRGGLFASSVPFDPSQTTAAATSGVSPSGGVIHVKGGRAPGEGALAGALLAGDLHEVQTSRGPQLMKQISPLDLDDAGLGTINARPPLRGTVLDNAPVILHNPLGKWLPVNPQSGWRNRAGGFIEPEPLELIEDIAPV